MMPEQHWVFLAAVTRVIDGDTLQLEIDTGMHARRTERCRLLGVDAPESRGASKAAGLAAKEWVMDWCGVPGAIPWPFIIRTEKDPDNFGRYLVRVYRRVDGRELSEDLVLAGHAVPRGE